MNKEKLMKICADVARDAQDDSKNFHRIPFTGKTVANYPGNHGALIAALANILREILDDNTDEYNKAWQEFTISSDYHKAMTTMFIMGLLSPESQGILRIAFDAGWNSKPKYDSGKQDI